MYVLEMVVAWPCEYTWDRRRISAVPGEWNPCYRYQPDNPSAWCSQCVETVRGAAVAASLGRFVTGQGRRR